jgi:hypothetical protein
VSDIIFLAYLNKKQPTEAEQDQQRHRQKVPAQKWCRRPRGHPGKLREEKSEVRVMGTVKSDGIGLRRRFSRDGITTVTHYHR